MDVKVLGPGCTKCKKLYAEVEKVIAETGSTAVLTKVDRVEDIMKFGVMVTPALVIDGEVKSLGRVPGHKEIAGWLGK